MFPFERLEVWKKSVVFDEAILEFADGFERRDCFSLGEQLRRSVISISNNIAEGGGRNNKKEKIYFYNIAKGSVCHVCGKRDLRKEDLMNKGLRPESYRMIRMLEKGTAGCPKMVA